MSAWRLKLTASGTCRPNKLLSGAASARSALFYHNGATHSEAENVGVWHCSALDPPSPETFESWFARASGDAGPQDRQESAAVPWNTRILPSAPPDSTRTSDCC